MNHPTDFSVTAGNVKASLLPSLGSTRSQELKCLRRGTASWAVQMKSSRTLKCQPVPFDPLTSQLSVCRKMLSQNILRN